VKRGILAVAIALMVPACGGGKPAPSPSPSGLGAELKAMEMDMNTMAAANAAANAAASDVIRASGDCDAARPLLPTANARLDEAQRKVQTATGQQTLDALRKKVRDVAENCP